MIMEQFEKIRAEFSECEAIALADISSQTVFCVSARKKPPQERIDALCEAATEILSGGLADGFATALGSPRGTLPQECFVMDRSDLLVFMRSPRDQDEVLLSICDARVDVERFLNCCRIRMTHIVQSQ